MTALEIVWLISVIFNAVTYAVFVQKIINKVGLERINIGYAVFLFVFAVLLGPVWSLGTIYAMRNIRIEEW